MIWGDASFIDEYASIARRQRFDELLDIALDEAHQEELSRLRHRRLGLDEYEISPHQSFGAF